MAHIESEALVHRQQALSDLTRIRIMRLLMERELCVCEIVAALREPQYKVSRHLAVLKGAGLVCDRREGAWMHYEIAADLAPEWRAALESLKAVWEQSTEVQAALWCLQKCAVRPANSPACCKG